MIFCHQFVNKLYLYHIYTKIYIALQKLCISRKIGKYINIVLLSKYNAQILFCISVILVILLLVIPNVTSKNTVVKNKGCEAQIEVVNSQILLYEIENGKLPTKISDLTSGSDPYLTEKQGVCPNGKKISIKNGQAYVR